jgi:hypothetical protein
MSVNIVPYRFGRESWSDYLVSVEHAVRAVGLQQHRDLATLNETIFGLRGQTLELRRDLIRGQEIVTDALSRLGEELGSGLTLLIELCAESNHRLETISRQLYMMHETLNAPRLTQAGELFRIGENRRKHGLLDKALDAYHESEELNDVDFLLQLQIGKLYLYGHTDDHDVVDLECAIRHLQQAMRFAAAAEADLGDAAREVELEARYHLSAAYYISASDAVISHNQPLADELIARATTILFLRPNIHRDALLLATQLHCRGGEPSRALPYLRELADWDRGALYRARTDPDLIPIRDLLPDLCVSIEREPGPMTIKVSRSVSSALIPLRRRDTIAFNATNWSDDSREIADKIHTIQRGFFEGSINADAAAKQLTKLEREATGCLAACLRYQAGVLHTQISNLEARRSKLISQMFVLDEEIRGAETAKQNNFFPYFWVYVGVGWFFATGIIGEIVGPWRNPLIYTWIGPVIGACLSGIHGSRVGRRASGIIEQCSETLRPMKFELADIDSQLSSLQEARREIGRELLHTDR